MGKIKEQNFINILNNNDLKNILKLSFENDLEEKSFDINIEINRVRNFFNLTIIPVNIINFLVFKIYIYLICG